MTLKADVDQLAADAALFHAVVHGSDTATVEVTAGTVSSLAKAVKDAAAPYASASASATAAAASLASAVAVVTGGTAQLGGGAGKIPICDSGGELPLNYGIKFPAAAYAASDANTLDDYEEGYFTASLEPQTSGSITLNTSFNQLQYTKIGRKVQVSGRIKVASVSSPVGYMRIALPFSVASLTQDADVAVGNVTFEGLTTNQTFIAFCVSGTGVIQVYAFTANGGGSTTNCANYVQADVSVYINLTYIAA